MAFRNILARRRDKREWKKGKQLKRGELLEGKKC
jgi:hypothetical protein